MTQVIVTSQNGRKEPMSSVSELPHPASSWNVNAAMRDIYDIGEKIQLWPILLGDAAKQIHDNPDRFFDLKLNKIEWCIPMRNNTPEIQSLFKTWGMTPNERGYEYSFEGIPIYIRLIKRHYAFFDKPDMGYYKVDEFMLPNPWSDYWKIRNLIR